MRYYRNCFYDGREHLLSCEADDELDAETEFYSEVHFESEKDDFEWLSSIMTIEDLQLGEELKNDN